VPLQQLKLFCTHLVKITLKKLSLFFLIGILIDDYDIVSLENILKKCVIIENNDEFFISICNDINEHD